LNTLNFGKKKVKPNSVCIRQQPIRQSVPLDAIIDELWNSSVKVTVVALAGKQLDLRHIVHDHQTIRVHVLHEVGCHYQDNDHRTSAADKAS
jgi:hypothetical protein